MAQFDFTGWLQESWPVACQTHTDRREAEAPIAAQAPDALNHAMSASPKTTPASTRLRALPLEWTGFHRSDVLIGQAAKLAHDFRP